MEGLLDEKNCAIVTDLLFELATWHALAKLRLHTSVTLDLLRAVTRHMYAAVRTFTRTTCQDYVTVELTRESEARGRREAARRKKAGASAGEGSTQRQPKVVEFLVHHTYKYHCLADYPDYIELHGTTDNMTTQTVSATSLESIALTHLCILQGECEHIVVKLFYDRTNKKAPEKQIATHQERRGKLHAIVEEMERMEAKAEAKAKAKAEAADKGKGKGKERAVPLDQDDAGPADDNDDEAQEPSLYARYVMGKSQRQRVDMYNWLANHDGDPACEVRRRPLKEW